MRDDVVKVQVKGGHWEVSYEAPRGLRYNSRFCWVTIFPNEDNQESLWLEEGTNTWKPWSKIDKSIGCSDCDKNSPKSFKAFLRYLKRHPELKGYKVVLAHQMAYIIDGEKCSASVNAIFVEE